MSNTTLDETVVDALHEHIQANKSMKKSVLHGIVGGEENFEAYKAAMIAKYPDKYETAADPEPTKPQEVVEEHSPEVETKYHFLNDKNQLQPLSVVTNKLGKVVLKLDEPTDIVVVQLKGKSESIDLYQLRKPGAVSPFEGVSVATLLMLGELAKG